MVNTGKEQAFKKNALAALKEKFPDIQFFFFQRMLKTTEFFTALRHVKDFCRILRDNANPVKFTGTALE